MRVSRYGPCMLAVAAVLAPSAGAAAQQANDDLLERGEYLAHIMDCTGCHTPGTLKGQPDHSRYLAGSEIGYQVPGYGVVYPSNLTSDPKTGLGDWSVEEIMRAVRKGERPDGPDLAPIMPWPEYAHLTDDDARALATFIKSLPPVEHAIPERAASPEEATHPYLTIEVPEQAGAHARE